MRRCLVFFTLAILLLFVTDAPIGAQSRMAGGRLVGTWRLVSARQVITDGEWTVEWERVSD